MTVYCVGGYRELSCSICALRLKANTDILCSYTDTEDTKRNPKVSTLNCYQIADAYINANISKVI